VKSYLSLRSAANTVISLRHRYMARVLLVKLFERIQEVGKNEGNAAELWASQHAIGVDSLAKNIDSELWHESKEVALIIQQKSSQKIEHLKNMGVDLGGGGAIDLLYFLTRKLKPGFVLETGVAAGWSSYSFLLALERNGSGVLLSSDLPYFRIKNSERYIGILVPSELSQHNWELQVEGDRINFKELLKNNRKLRLVHWDSDKRKIARKNFFKFINEYLEENSVLVMDDIQNNLAFKEYVESKDSVFRIIESQGKYVGIVFFGSCESLVA